MCFLMLPGDIFEGVFRPGRCILLRHGGLAQGSLLGSFGMLRRACKAFRSLVLNPVTGQGDPTSQRGRPGEVYWGVF